MSARRALLIVFSVTVSLVIAHQLLVYPREWNRLGLERGRYQRTRAELLTIAKALHAYAADHEQSFPALEASVSELAPQLEPKYVLKLPTHDAWRRPILFSSDGSCPSSKLRLAI